MGDYYFIEQKNNLKQKNKRFVISKNSLFEMRSKVKIASVATRLRALNS
jgi:hypothetical protein